MSEVSEIYSILRSHGPAYYGSDREAPAIAEEWADYFSVAEAEEWMKAGFWCPATAKKVDELDILPRDVAQICDALPNLSSYHSEPHGPVYAMCNGDFLVCVYER